MASAKRGGNLFAEGRQKNLIAMQDRYAIAFLDFGDQRQAARLIAMRAETVEFLSKPFDDELLVESVRSALER